MIQTDYGFNKFQSSDEMYTTTMNGLNDNVDIEVGLFDQLNATITNLQKENAELIAQIPTYTPTPATALNIQDSSNLPIKDFALLGNATQSSTPTPDTPVPVSVVTGDNTVKVLGKNLFSAEKVVQDSDTNTIYITDDEKKIHFVTGGNRLLIKAVGGFQVNTQYTIKGTIINSGDTNAVGINFIYTDGTYTEITSGSMQPNATKTFSATSSSGKTIDVIRTSNTANKEAFLVIEGCQLEVGSTATTYEPYTSQTQLLSLGDIELAKLKSGNSSKYYQDRIYKNSGKWYLEKNTMKLILGNYSFNAWNPVIRTNTIQVCKNNFNARPNSKIMCNSFENTTLNSTLFNSDAEYVADGAGYASRVYISINKTRINYTEEMTNDEIISAIKDWCTNNGTYVETAINSPTTTEITDTTLIEQLENVLKMSTYKNTTNIFTIVASGNAQGELKVEYRADLQTKIDNLTTAILSL